MAKPRSDVLQLLANPTNRSILSILSVEPQYPRRLAEIVGLTEDEASRRLRAFAALGLAEAEWANVGKTVRLYRLASSRLTVQVTPGGLTVSGLPGEKRLELEAAREAPPALPSFVGREEELTNVASLLESRRALCLHGIGGVGKTSLTAAFAARRGGSVSWHTLAPGETGTLLLSRLANDQRALEGTGERAQRLLNIAASDDAQLLLQTILESANALGTLLILDKFEVAGDGAGEVAASLARGLSNGRLLVTSRTFPRDLPRDMVGSLTVGGLAREDVEALVDALGGHLSPDNLALLYDRTRGHALSVVLAALASATKPDLPVDRLVEESGIREFLMTSLLPQLADAERDALTALSVFRDPFTAEEAEAVTDSKHAVHALLRLEARSLVTRSGDSYRMHDLVRSFALDALAQRKVVHGRAAKALKASGEADKVLEAMHHYLEAGAAKEALAVVREETTRRVYRFADLGLGPRYREALVRLSMAPTLDAPGRSAVEIELGHLDILVGEADAAAKHLDSAQAALGRRKRDPLATRLVHMRAKLLFLEGRMEDASVRYAEATKVAEDAADPDALLEILIDHAFCEEQVSDEKALAIYERAMKLGATATDIRCNSLAYSGAARISARNGDKRFLPWTDEAMRLARMAGYLRGEVSVYMTLTTHTMITGEVARGAAFADEYLTLARRLGDPWLMSCALGDKAYLLVAEGKWEEARPLAEEFLRLAQQVKSDFYTLHASTCLAESELHLGRAEKAREVLAPALVKPLEAWPVMSIRAWIVMGRILRALGRKEEAAEARAKGRRIYDKAKLESAWTLKWISFEDEPPAAARSANGKGNAKKTPPPRPRTEKAGRAKH